ncbi:MAG: pyridoxal phosphate-dependent aminotransferase family protein [Deltaproteobacteria bacterium]|nr:pyridoxal phosphate-dependent aminotransferase family protein [Deltaproteobacteria bacterium]
MPPGETDIYEYTYDMFLSSIEGEQSEATRFSEWMDAVEADGRYAFEALRQGAQRPEVEVVRTSGLALRLVNLASYNYLGLGYHPVVIEAAQAALARYGLGAASSPVIAGTLQVHKDLEASLLDFLGLPGRGVSLFSSGYGVNTGTLAAVVKRRHHVVVDRSAHMSILEGAQLSRASVHYFNHNDAADLEAVLEGLGPDSGRVLVCTEGVFSADGDLGNLGAIVPVAKRFGAQVLVDEAHSFLVAGPGGRGVCEEHGVLDQVDYLVVTFSKALGGVGGAVIAKREVARYINWYARCRMFSCAIDPAVTAGVTAALRIGAGPEGAERRRRVVENAALLRRLLSPQVLVGRTESWIVPVIYGEERLTLKLCDWLQREGIDGSVMEFPAVPVSEARLRLFVTADHTAEQLSRAAEVIIRAAHHFGFARPATTA